MEQKHLFSMVDRHGLLSFVTGTTETHAQQMSFESSILKHFAATKLMEIFWLGLFLGAS